MRAMNAIFCFDGTGNDPQDAEEAAPGHGGWVDEGITNVLKTYLLAGGNLATPQGDVCTVAGVTQATYYYRGIGTSGLRFHRLLEQMFAVGDFNTILESALNQLSIVWGEGQRQGTLPRCLFLASVAGRPLPAPSRAGRRKAA